MCRNQSVLPDDTAIKVAVRLKRERFLSLKPGITSESRINSAGGYLMDQQTMVYRIISLEGLMSILINKEERFVRPIDSWEDTFEGYMLHMLDSQDGMKTILSRLYIMSGRNQWITIRNLSKLLRSRYACYGQCWSKNPDSDAMWRIYSYDKKAIQLVSKIGSIQSMIDDAAWEGLETEIAEVKYDINDETEALNKILIPTAKIDMAYFHKRPAFKHESEVRVLLNDLKKYESIDVFASTAIGSNLKYADPRKTEPEQIQEAVSHLVNDKGGYLSIAPKEVKMEIKDMKSYLNGIRVHPQAPDWYVALIRKICRNYKISFMGKSDLYRPAI